MHRKIIVLGEPEHEIVDPVQPPGGSNPLTGAVWINDVNEMVAKEFAASVLKTSHDDPQRPIMVYIDSFGGSVDAMAAMISVMDSVPNKIVTICTGKAMSAGAFLLSHGDFRYVAPHARVMIHEISSGTIGHVDDIKNDIKETDRLNEYWMELLARNCGVKGGYKALKKLLTSQQRDAYMTASEAVKFGIADRVGLPRINRVVQWHLSFDGEQVDTLPPPPVPAPLKKGKK